MSAPTSYTSLEPSFTSSIGLPSTTFQPGQVVSLIASTSFIYNFLLIACIAAAGFVYARGGMLRLQASEAGIRKSNEEFKRGTLGLLGVLSLFLILYTVNRGLLLGDVGLGALRTNASTTPATTGTVAIPNPPATSSGTHSYADRVASHNSVLARLYPSGIRTNHNEKPCTEAQFNESKPSCTSLAYLPEESIQMLLRINGSCNCALVITGGTEPGHAINGAHGEGRRGFDLRLDGPRGSLTNTDSLYVFIKGVGSSNFGSNSVCFMRYTWSSFTFCDEKPPNEQHFHVF